MDSGCLGLAWDHAVGFSRLVWVLVGEDSGVVSYEYRHCFSRIDGGFYGKLMLL